VVPPIQLVEVGLQAIDRRGRTGTDLVRPRCAWGEGAAQHHPCCSGQDGRLHVRHARRILPEDMSGFKIGARHPASSRTFASTRAKLRAALAIMISLVCARLR
jgi:hypothetical protein